MKITVSYIPEEEGAASSVLAALLRLLPGVRVRKKEAHPPFKHLYLTTRKGEKALGEGGNT